QRAHHASHRIQHGRGRLQHAADCHRDSGGVRQGRAPARGERDLAAWSKLPAGRTSMPETTDLFDIIKTTRAMRRLKPDPVPDALIRKILEAGVCAPNGGNTQRWRFLVVKDPAIKKKVQVWYKKAFDEVVGPRYLKSAPPPGVTKDAYVRQHAAVE